MGFNDFCIETKWWFLIGAFLIFFYAPDLAIFSLIMFMFSIIGFINNDSLTNKTNYSLPAGFDYPDKVKKDDFIKCPVCKKGKIIPDKEKPKFRNCNVCNAHFKETRELSFKLSTKNCEDEYKEYNYNNCNLSVYEWNTIALTNKTLRENTLENFRNGDIPNSSNQNIDSPAILKSKEHLVWGEQSRLDEPRAVRHYGGTSLRVAKGVRIHMGQSESHQEMRQIDNGYLTLTNKRLIFSGEKRSSNIDLRKIMNVTIYLDGFKVNIENRQKPQFFATKDSEFWSALLTGTMKNIN